MKHLFGKRFIQNQPFRKRGRVGARYKKIDLSPADLLRDHFSDPVLEFAQVAGQTGGDLKKFVIDGFDLDADETLGDLQFGASEPRHAFNQGISCLDPAS
jgi:hypothetical protein